MAHTPVLLEEVLAYLAPAPGEFMIDGTLDGGGHAEAIWNKLQPTGMLLGVDWDSRMTDRFATRHGSDRNVRTANANYAGLAEVLEVQKLPKADGLLLDLGFSSEQLESSGRGFSFMADEPLLMTYSDERPPVKELLERVSKAELENILREYGGERMAGRVAEAIHKARRVRTSRELAEIVRQALPKNYEHGRIDPATRTFQALRIWANGELENLSKVLADLPKILKAKGRIVIISFHSLEDRIVKQAFREAAKRGEIEVLTKEPVEASALEVNKNPRSRSAKLRAAKILI